MKVEFDSHGEHGGTIAVQDMAGDGWHLITISFHASGQQFWVQVDRADVPALVSALIEVTASRATAQTP